MRARRCGPADGTAGDIVAEPSDKGNRRGVAYSVAMPHRGHDCGQDVPGFVPLAAEEMAGTVAARFTRVAAARAGRHAVITARGARTYGELDRASARIARALLDLDGAAARSVCVFLDSDVEMAEAFLGVARAGKRYVPVDPRLPEARARAIVEDAEAAIVITDAAHRDLADRAAPPGVRLVDVGALDPAVSDAPPEIDIAPDAHLWIVYTSGSTGQPKGVLQTHRNLMRYLWAYANAFRLSPDDRVTSLFSLAVNGGLHDLLISLSTGGCFCPWSPVRDGAAGLWRFARAHGTTILSGVPTAFRQAVAALAPDELIPGVRLLRLWGEALYRRDFEAFRRHFPPGSRLVNRLGSSETGPLRWTFLDHGASFEGNAVPVGWDAPDVETGVVGEAGHSVAPGEVGEIVARSRYLSPGYWRQPEATAAVFSSDPADPAIRRYRTGDLGRLLPDGNCVPAGRKDSQVKIRGHRVELDELEQALLRHPAVRDAVVTGRPGAEDDTRLVAYVVARAGASPTVTSLRRALAASVPDAMIPSVFVMLDALPQAQNGKVNRRALPAPGRGRPVLDALRRAPRDPLEETLARVWEEVLGMDGIGVDDPFLELGGDSLLAMKVVARVGAVLAIDVPVADVLAASTVAELAATLRGALDRVSPR